MIPAALIERIDVLTGGASSVYGADAVAGVVNFVMDTDFEGFKLDTQYSVYNHDNRNDSADHRSARRAWLWLSARSCRPMAALSTPRSRSVPASMTAAAGPPPMSAIARSTRSLQSTRDYSSCALSGSSRRSSCTRQLLHLRWLGHFADHGTLFASDRRRSRTGPPTSLR